jgi:glyoxylase-like metal-dependent hydrolase (beta-lactamase superfamily II)
LHNFEWIRTVLKTLAAYLIIELAAGGPEGIFLQAPGCPKSSDSLIGDEVIFIRGDLTSANGMALFSKNEVLLVDCGDSQEFGNHMKDMVEKKVRDPVYKYLVLTHHHMDHTAGYSCFPEAATIAHDDFRIYLDPIRPAGREQSDERGETNAHTDLSGRDLPPPPLPDESPFFTTLPAINDSTAEWVLSCKPDLTFSHELCLMVGRIPVNLIHMGRFHTESDIMIFIPQKKVLVSGDLFFKDQLPVFAENLNLEVERWLEVLSVILELSDDSLVIIPGHGEPLNREELQACRDYIATLHDAVRGHIASGVTDDVIVKKCALSIVAPEMQDKDVLDNTGRSRHAHNTQAMIRSIRTEMRVDRN